MGYLLTNLPGPFFLCIFHFFSSFPTSFITFYIKIIDKIFIKCFRLCHVRVGTIPDLAFCSISQFNPEMRPRSIHYYNVERKEPDTEEELIYASIYIKVKTECSTFSPVRRGGEQEWGQRGTGWYRGWSEMEAAGRFLKESVWSLTENRPLWGKSGSRDSN